LTQDTHATLTLSAPRAIELGRLATRREHDLLGEADVPADAYWGIHTLRAVENFPITGIPIGHFPELVRALALVAKDRSLPRSIRGRCGAGRRGHIDQYERQ